MITNSIRRFLYKYTCSKQASSHYRRDYPNRHHWPSSAGKLKGGLDSLLASSLLHFLVLWLTRLCLSLWIWNQYLWSFCELYTIASVYPCWYACTKHLLTEQCYYYINQGLFSVWFTRRLVIVVVSPRNSREKHAVYKREPVVTFGKIMLLNCHFSMRL